jgi:phosphotriesterase-related protein
MPTVQTVRGRIDARDLGITYGHDHLIMRPPAAVVAEDPTLQLDDYDAALRELGTFKLAGGQALVEMTTVELGRSPRELKALAEARDVRIIAATGYNKGKFAEGIVAAKSVDDLTNEMVRDVTEGMDGTDIRAGVLKASSSKNGMSANETKVFHAAAAAHRQTGAPISTHTEAGTYALEQIALFRSLGVDPGHVLIGHLDRRLDWDYHQAIADTGVFMGFDQLGKEKYYPDALRIDFIRRLIAAGYGKQIILSGDIARKSNWPSYGFGYGPGLTFILWRFIPWLLESGVTRAQVDDLLIHNPARAFAWTDIS